MKTKSYIATLLLFSLVQIGYSQYGADRELFNLCNEKRIMTYGEQAPRPKMGMYELKMKINDDVQLFEEHSKFSGRIQIECTISCEGVIDNFYVITGSGNADLDKMLVDYLKTITEWNPGKDRGQNMDYWYLWNFKIKKGVIQIKTR